MCSWRATTGSIDPAGRRPSGNQIRSLMGGTRAGTATRDVLRMPTRLIRPQLRNPSGATSSSACSEWARLGWFTWRTIRIWIGK